MMNQTTFDLAFCIPTEASPNLREEDLSIERHRANTIAGNVFSQQIPASHTSSRQRCYLPIPQITILPPEEFDQTKLFELLDEDSRNEEHQKICGHLMEGVEYWSRGVMLKVMKDKVYLEKRIAVIELAESVLSKATSPEDKVDFLKLAALLPDRIRNQTSLKIWIDLLLQVSNVLARADIVRRFELLPEHQRDTENLQACIDRSK